MRMIGVESRYTAVRAPLPPAERLNRSVLDRMSKALSSHKEFSEEDLIPFMQFAINETPVQGRDGVKTPNEAWFSFVPTHPMKLITDTPPQPNHASVADRQTLEAKLLYCKDVLVQVQWVAQVTLQKRSPGTSPGFQTNDIVWVARLSGLVRSRAGTSCCPSGFVHVSLK